MPRTTNWIQPLSIIVRPHIPEEEFHAFADGELSLAQRAEIAEHLLGCLICRVLFGEVQDLRARTASLLAIASPRTIARPAMPAPRRLRRPWIGIAAASAAAIGFSTWLAVQPAPDVRSTPRLATAFVAPTIFARIGSGVSPATEPPALTPTQRTLTLAMRTVIRPEVTGPAPVPAAAMRRLRPVEPMAELDPSAGWETISWDAAVALGRGSLAHLDGFVVSAVRIQRSARGGRPTFLVRHQLPDGRSLWVVEGPVEDVGPVHRLLEASGLSMSMPLRARPDYVGTDEAPTRTVRMVTLAGYLPVDSLDVMVGKLRLE